MDIAQLAIKVETGGVRQGVAALDGLTKAGERAEKATGSLGATAKKTNTEMRGLAAAGSAVGAAFIGVGFVRMADQATELNNKLKLVTTSTQNLAMVQGQLVSMANATGASLLSVGDVYSKIARAGKELGVSQNTLLSVTDTITKAVAISGGSAESANAALMQLSQGLASGTLRGEELNSVMEQTPRLASAIAEGLGITVGQLRELGKEGKITSTALIDALGKAAKSVDAEFSQVNKTLTKTLVNAKDAAMLMVADFDKAAGITSTLASGVEGAVSVLGGLVNLLKSNSVLFESLGGAIKWAAILGAATVAAGAATVAFTALSVAIGPIGLAVIAIAAAIGAVTGAIGALMNTTAALEASYGNVNKELAETELRIDRLRKKKDNGGLTAVGEGLLANEEAKLKKLQKSEEKIRKDLANKRAETPSVGSDLRKQEIADRNAEKTAREAKARQIKDASEKKKGDGEDKYKTEIAALTRKMQLDSESTELERVNLGIRLERYGKLNDAQKQHLQSLAAEADSRRALAAIEDKIYERTQAINESNAALELEIETLGMSAEELRAHERAQNLDAIATKQREIANRQQIPGQEQSIRLLQQEIDALERRSVLLNKKEEKTKQVEAKKATDEAIKKQEALAKKIEDSITDGFVNGFKNGKSLTDIFVEELKATFARVVLRPLIEPVAKDLARIGGSTGDGGSDLLGSILGAAGSFFGGNDPSSKFYENQFDLMNIPGRAVGGQVSPFSMTRVNERGPEVISTGGSDYLMMGGNGGTVTANSSLGGGTVSQNLVINIDSRTDQGQVRQLVGQAVRAGNAKLIDDLRTAGRL
jgi:tape measure domain-containing protein